MIIDKILKVGVSIIVAVTLSSLPVSLASSKSNDFERKVDFFKPVIDKLLKKGADTNFVYGLLSDERTSFNEKFININVLGYLKKPDYSKHYDARSVNKCLEFLNENDSILIKCQNKYGIPKEVLTALLWIETRTGDYLGDYHVPSVFFSSAMANQEKYIKRNKLELRKEFDGSQGELNKLEKKIEKRARRKAKWAVREILYLEKMQKDKGLDVLALKGSWAGAFGLPQFLPSSYIKWAADGNDDSKIDLFAIEDAVHSAANYLKTNGWGNTRKQQKKAVYNYNHSWDYVNAVLTLANKIEKRLKND